MRRLVLNEARLMGIARDITLDLPSLTGVRQPRKSGCASCGGDQQVQPVADSTWISLVEDPTFAIDMERLRRRAGVDQIRVAVAGLVKDF